MIKVTKPCFCNCLQLFVTLHSSRSHACIGMSLQMQQIYVFSNPTKGDTKWDVIELSSGVVLISSKISKFPESISEILIFFLLASHTHMFQLDMPFKNMSQFSGAGVVCSLKGNCSSQNTHCYSQWPSDVCDSAWLPFVLCLSSTPLKSSVPEKCY